MVYVEQRTSRDAINKGPKETRNDGIACLRMKIGRPDKKREERWKKIYPDLQEQAHSSDGCDVSVR